MQGLAEARTYEIIPAASLPPNTKPIQAIWSFRCKHLPDWTISKWKAHLCPHGGQQELGVNYWETNWSTVCLVLILSLLTGLQSRQIDYIQAYTQVPLDYDLYMRIPAGFHVTDHSPSFSDGKWTNSDDRDYVLKLKKNLCGLEQAGSNWFCMLREGLLTYRFMQSKIDSCLFLRKDIILIVYVDDCFLFVRKPKTLDKLISSLQQEFTLADEGYVSVSLGLDIRCNERGHLELMQPGLIQKIIEECRLESESKEHGMPAVTKILDKDEQGPERESEWEYRTIIRMLMYLSVSS